MRQSFRLLAFISLIISGCGDNNKDLDIYLLIGQSNMAGRGYMTGADTNTLYEVLLFNSEDRFEPARHPLNRYSTIRKDLNLQGISLGYEFGRYLAEATGHTIGLVVNARGGTSIDEWQKGGLYYSEAVRRTREAMKQGTLKAILWNQGSADQRHPETYTGKLKVMITDIRNDLDDEDLPFVMGQLGSWRQISEPFNEMLLHVPDSIEYTACITTEGLEANYGDSLHFNASSLNILGRRYAECVLQMVY